MLSQFRSTRSAVVASALALTFGLISCSGGTNTGTDTAANTTGTTTEGGTQIAGGQNVRLNGAGASFPAPLYETWFAEYNKQHPNVQISYQSVGSGAGVKQFTEGTVDFGASDVAMKDEEIEKVQRGVLMVPMTAGSIVLAYNLPGVENIKLSRDAYTGILLGKITNWNDPAIAAENPNAQLPDKPITVIHRSDGSGTTGVFTKHLSEVSADWKNGPGEGKTVEWPVGTGAKGNEGVTELIKQTEGSIGYVEYGYAKNQGLSMASLENKAGKYVEPTPEAASKTLDAVELPENFRAFIADPEGDDSYPIVTYTWLLAYKQYDDPAKAEAVEDMIEWSLNSGQQFSKDLGYIPLPEGVVKKVMPTVEQISQK